MEQFTNPVTAVCLDNPKTTRLGVLLNDIAERRELDAWLGVCNCQIKTLSCCFDQANNIGVFRGRTNVVSFIQICMVTFVP